MPFVDLKDFVPFYIREDISGGKISWIKTGMENFTDPFFADTIRRLRSSRAEEIDTAATSLLNQELKEITPAGFIFHVSRCGSTLLSNALRNIANNLVIAEADTINTLLLSLLKANSNKEQTEQLLRSLINWYGRNDTQKLFIKFSSWNTTLISLIQNTWPDTPVVFSFREPQAVIQSLLQKRAGWFSFYNDPIVKSKFTGDPHLSFIHFILAIVKTTFENGLKACNTIFVDYGDQKLDNIRRMLSHFNIQPSATEWKMIQEKSDIYSKDNKQQKLFHPRKTNTFPLPENIAAIIQTEIGPIYKQLQKMKG